MNDIDVSIVIPVYNVKDYVDDCIQSVMNQEMHSGVRIECIVVDDRGTDNSMDIVYEVIEHYNGPIEFKIIKHNKNRGLSAARNTGIAHARGKYLFFIDSDDYISKDCIDNLYTLSLKYPKAELVIGNAVFLYNDGTIRPTIKGNKFRKNYYDDLKDVQRTYFNLPISACNKLIKRDWLLESHLYFKEGILYEDNHWSFNAYHFLTSYVISLNISYSYFYRQRSDSIMSNIENRQKKDLVYNGVFLDAVKNVQSWDKYFTKKIVEYLFDLKVTSHGVLLNHTVNRLLSLPQAKLSHKIVFSYFKLNRPWLRIRVAKNICMIIR